jgi:spore maturation protein CgeB
VEYLPFGFDPDLFYPVVSGNQEKTERFSFDVAFAGGADRDRIPYLTAMIKAGFRIGLYGAYWDRYPETRKHALGYADPGTLRRVFGSSKVTLCLVRRSNRDGNSMRSFEAPAAGACVLAEDTPEHREIFGEEGEAACFFGTPKEAVEKTRWLLAHESERLRMAGRSFERITQGRNTYQDRLREMLRLPSEGS